MSNASLLINGLAYEGWESVDVKRAIDAVSGAFSLTLSERWAGNDKPWQIKPGDSCELRLDNLTVLTGYVDSISPSYSGTTHTVTVTGRDKAADMVDCSAVHKPDQWTNYTLLQLATTLGAPFGIKAKALTSVGGKFPLVKLEHGEMAWAALERHCRQRGVLAYSDGVGGLVLTTVGTKRAQAALVAGDNILSASGTLDNSQRFSRYIVKGQAAGSSDAYDAESSAHIESQFTDGSIKRYRPLIVMADGQSTIASARTRAIWEKTVRAGRAISATITVQGWRQVPNGRLWDINELVEVSAPWLQIQGTMLISEVAFSKSSAGTLTDITISSPDAFSAEPEEAAKAKKKASDKTGNPWEAT